MKLGDGDYQMLVKGELKQYTHWDDIPEEFDNVVKFVPTIPPEPHTREQHDWIDTLQDKFREILKREKGYDGSNSNR